MGGGEYQLNMMHRQEIKCHVSTASWHLLFISKWIPRDQKQGIRREKAGHLANGNRDVM